MACRRVWRVIGVCKQTKGGVLPAMQIMVALRVFASGGFQLDVGDTFGTNLQSIEVSSVDWIVL